MKNYNEYNEYKINIITEIEKFIQIYFSSNSFKQHILSQKRKNKPKISENIDFNLSKILNKKRFFYKRI